MAGTRAPESSAVSASADSKRARFQSDGRQSVLLSCCDPQMCHGMCAVVTPW